MTLNVDFLPQRGPSLASIISDRPREREWVSTSVVSEGEVFKTQVMRAVTEASRDPPGREIVVGCSGGYAVVGSSDENADIHHLLPLTEELECDSFIWIDSSKDIREAIMRFRGTGFQHGS